MFQFEYQDFVGIEPLVSRNSDTEFIIKYRKNREGRKTGDMKFASEYRADILTEALVNYFAIDPHVMVVCSSIQLECSNWVR